jgi:hypothetical protein
MKRTEDSSDKGRNPKESSVRGSSPEGKLPFSIDVKGGEINQMHGEKEQRHDSRGVMVTGGA